MLAFQNTTHTKESAVALAKLHREQDDYTRGTYGEKTKDGGWKGCSVGCMAKGKHEDYPELFGIDVRIAHISDVIFEHVEDYKNWTVDLFESVKDGSDTTIAYYKFMHWLLSDLNSKVIDLKTNEEVATVANLFLRASEGETTTKSDWINSKANAYAAAAATDAAADDAADDAYATYAAYAAYVAATDDAYATYAAAAATDAAYAAYAAATAYAAYAADAAAATATATAAYATAYAYAYAAAAAVYAAAAYKRIAAKLMWFLAGN
jgi:hypothetical protein